MMNTKRRYVLAITGASGAQFAVSLLGRMLTEPTVEQVLLLFSPTGQRCLLEEVGLRPENLVKDTQKISLLDEKDLGAEISSGSALHSGMVIIPCSMGTLGRIASGTSDNLITRAADVCLKERRPLILCVRETPLNRIHMENMLRAHDSGAIVMPLMPAFYHSPKSVENLCDAFATRVLDQLGMFQEDGRRWRGDR
jgi:4-hydroxy-3-polyprenylbenzoate decarboxylase